MKCNIIRRTDASHILVYIIPVNAPFHMSDQAAERAIERWRLLAARHSMPWAHALPTKLVVDYSALYKYYPLIREPELPHWSHVTFATMLVSFPFGLEAFTTESTQMGILQQRHIALDMCHVNKTKALASFFSPASSAASVCMVATMYVSENTCSKLRHLYCLQNRQCYHREQVIYGPQPSHSA